MIVHRVSGTITGAHTRDLPDLLTPGDLVVVHDTRVSSAPVRAPHAERWSGGVPAAPTPRPGALGRAGPSRSEAAPRLPHAVRAARGGARGRNSRTPKLRPPSHPPVESRWGRCRR